MVFKNSVPWTKVAPALEGLNTSDSESTHQMNTNMTGFRWFSNNICASGFWGKVASALERLNKSDSERIFVPCIPDKIISR